MAKAAAKKVAKTPVKKSAFLPVWDLSDLYPSPAHPSVAADLKSLAKQAAAFLKAG